MKIIKIVKIEKIVEIVKIVKIFENKIKKRIFKEINL